MLNNEQVGTVILDALRARFPFPCERDEERVAHAAAFAWGHWQRSKLSDEVERIACAVKFAVRAIRKRSFVDSRRDKCLPSVQIIASDHVNPETTNRAGFSLDSLELAADLIETAGALLATGGSTHDSAALLGISREGVRLRKIRLRRAITQQWAQHGSKPESLFTLADYAEVAIRTLEACNSTC